MRNNFRTYHLAVEFYRTTQGLRLPRHLKEQLDRAASSIVLNLAEGAAKPTRPDQLKFFHIAFGSLRESQAILDLGAGAEHESHKIADSLAAHIYKLIKTARGG